MQQIIRQRFNKDCMLACVAMLLNVSYDFLLERLGTTFVEHVKENGVYGSDNIDLVFGTFGIKRGRDFHALIGPAAGLPPEFTVTAKLLKPLLWGRRALIQTKSKNNEGEGHMTYWDGSALYDPSNLKTFTWDEVDPQYVYLFNETKPRYGA